MTPNAVPTPAPTIASPPVMNAGTLLRGSGGGGGGAAEATGAAATGAGGGGGGGAAASGSASSAPLTVCLLANSTSPALDVHTRPLAAKRTLWIPAGSSTANR